MDLLSTALAAVYLSVSIDMMETEFKVIYFEFSPT